MSAGQYPLSQLVLHHSLMPGISSYGVTPSHDSLKYWRTNSVSALGNLISATRWHVNQIYDFTDVNYCNLVLTRRCNSASNVWEGSEQQDK